MPPFEPPPALRNPHLQTVVSRIARSRIAPAYLRERIETADGDFLDLDIWPLPGGEPPAVCLLLHGLEGSSRSGYMVSTAAALAEAGIQAVALNFRSCGGELNLTPGSYHSGRTDDIERSLAWMAQQYPRARRVAAGFSLGGNALLNLLGRAGSSPGVAATAAVSVPYDLALCSDALERGIGRLYAHRFLRTLRKKAREKARMFPGAGASAAAAAKTIREFDELLTAPLHGFRNAADYYERCSAKRFVGTVEIPSILIQSRDDPMVPSASVPLDTIGRKPNLSLVLTRRGGHVGFYDRALGTGREGWLEQSIVRYLLGALA